MSVVLQFRTIRNSTVAINDQWAWLLLMKPELLWLLIIYRYIQYVYPDRKAVKTGSSFSSSQSVLQRLLFRKASPFTFFQFYFNWPNYLRWVCTIRRPRKLSFEAAYFNICDDGKWRHHLIIHHHLRFERFLILHRCYAKLFNDLRLNKTLIITKTFKNAALKSGCFWSGCWFDGAAFVHCVSCHGDGTQNWKQSRL